jgi:hypothetical protein
VVSGEVDCVPSRCTVGAVAGPSFVLEVLCRRNFRRLHPRGSVEVSEVTDKAAECVNLGVLDRVPCRCLVVAFAGGS